MMSLIRVLVIICSIAFVSSQQNPTISFVTKEKVVEIGDSVDLICTVQFAGDYPVNWIKVNEENSNNYLFISRGATVNVPFSRYSVDVTSTPYDSASSTATYTLTISKIQEVDSGRYSCQIVTGSTSKIAANVEVFVRIPPVISDNSTRSVIASTGEDIDLYCYALGYPTPLIYWRREKNKLLPGKGAHYKGNRLTLHNATKDDRGTYYCVADNGVSHGSRRSVGVELEFLPFVTAERARYGQALQHDAILTCHIESFPSPSVAWYKDGVALNDNQYYEISIFATSEEFMDTSLKVKRIISKQYGKYTCRATNKLGTDFKEIELFETVNPICPPACDALISPYSSSPPTLTMSSHLYLPVLSLVLVTSYLYR
ncbi:Lachesin [Halotydeus destructor]|nr:Lachesin [Halotydeus destructor]